MHQVLTEEDVKPIREMIQQMRDNGPLIKELVEEAKPILKEVVKPVVEAFNDVVGLESLVLTNIATELAKSMLQNPNHIAMGNLTLAAKAIDIAKEIVRLSKQ